MMHAIRWRLCGAAMAFAVSASPAILSAPPALAAGKLNVVARFTAGQSELSVASYFDPAAADKGGKSKKVGLLGIAVPTRNSFAFQLDEWKALIALSHKAGQTKSAVWSVVGTLKETGTSDVSQLTVSAGPGVRLVISSPKGATVGYVLQKADMPRFEKALQEVRDDLSK